MIPWTGCTDNHAGRYSAVERGELGALRVGDRNTATTSSVSSVCSIAISVLRMPHVPQPPLTTFRSRSRPLAWYAARESTRSEGSMADTQRFECPSCGKKSEYEDRYSVVRMDGRDGPTPVETTRTYKCQSCGKPVAITMERNGWSLVDEWVRTRKSP